MSWVCGTQHLLGNGESVVLRGRHGCPAASNQDGVGPWAADRAAAPGSMEPREAFATSAV